MAVGLPGDHVAAVGQGGRRRPLLGAGGVGVELLLGVGERGAVLLARHVDLHRPGVAGAAVAVIHAQGDGAAGLRAVGAVGVGEVLDEGLDRVDAGVGIEADREHAAVAAAAEGADGHRAAAVVVADGVARHADLRHAGALVAHPELVFGAAELRVKNFDTAAVEVRGVEIEEADRRVDDLRRGIDEVFAEGEGAGEVAEFRVRLAGQLGGVAEELLVNAALAAVLAFGAPHHHVVAAAQAGDGRLGLGALGGRRGVGLELAAERGAVGGVFAHVDVLVGAAAAAVVVVVVPGDRKTTAREGRHVGLVLAAGGALVDPELAARRGAGGVVALPVHAGAAAVLAVGAPHDDEAAALEGRHPGFVLAVRGGRIDPELAAGRAAVGVVALGLDAAAAAVLAVGAPYDDEAAVGGGRHVGLVLAAAGGGVDAELVAAAGQHRGAGVVEALGVYAIAAAVLAVGIPGDDVATAVGGDARLALVVAGEGVDLQLAAQQLPAGADPLHVNPVAAAVGAAAVGPHHREAAVGEAGHPGFELVIGGGGVDAELRPGREPRGGEALGVDAVVAAVLLTGRPHHHVAATCER